MTKICKQTSKQRNACASYGWINIVGKLGTGLRNSLFCSSIGSEIKTGINLICENKKQQIHDVMFCILLLLSAPFQSLPKST